MTTVAGDGSRAYAIVHYLNQFAAGIGAENSADLPPLEADTTFVREVVFVLSHTVHHNALIGVMAKTLGVPLPPYFGYAPSTIAHLEQSACAQ